MMILSRFWYAVQALAAAFVAYVLFLALAQYNHRSSATVADTLSSDSITVNWALQIDARRRLDALLVGAVDKGVQEGLIGALGKDKVPSAARESTRKALASVLEKVPAEYRGDALFAVDRDGRVVAQVGFDQANAFEDFELGGYAAVNDAIHGYLRDDTWVLGGKIYRVVARPVEYDATAAPAGAIVALRTVDNRFAQEVSRRTRTNVAFFSSGVRVGAAGTEGFEENRFDFLNGEYAKLDGDKTYRDVGRSEVHPLTEDVSAVFARIPGEAWELGAGYAVVRDREPAQGPFTFLSRADAKDKSQVPVGLLGGLAVGSLLLGILFSYFEHSLPLRRFSQQAEGLKAGRADAFALSGLLGAYRGLGQAINEGIARIAEKGGVPGKAADLASILGPTPSQPALSAFSVPQPGGLAPPASGPTSPGSGSASRPFPPGAPRPPGPPPPPSGLGAASSGPNPALAGGPPSVPGARTTHPSQLGSGAARAFDRPTTPSPMGVSRLFDADAGDGEMESTKVGDVPPDVLAEAKRERSVDDETSEWLGVFEDFVRTKKQCGESTDGLTFEKFQNTLRKNRDALVEKHGCRRVKFLVYVKDGRASLKATPLKD